ncbi:MAG TPA: hypothetical protein VKR55_14905 [Bradyrhizobium sp.]|uniref:hypothetical protein n=1 Tax=Bradyrhizobium sp. TaxID=376 RepID=UPI002C19E6B5|nr:hypothetical protein [Bradyrhizobium sp.]HLZ03426.1 hypothetical protein [Bradyrhizobium sp.]
MTSTGAQIYRNSGGITEITGTPDSGGVFWVTYALSVYAGVAEMTGYSNFAVGQFQQTAAPVDPVGDKTKSSEQVEFEKRKARLIDAVTAMKSSAPNWSGRGTRVSEASAQSAKKFLECLPGNARLPRVAPDGEGDVMFVWDNLPGGQSCVVTVEKRDLHLACGLGTPEAQHVDAQRFLGLKIPKAIFDRIPSK